MIAISGAIGTGLFISSREALNLAGPLASLVAFTFLAVITQCVMHTLAEIITIRPITTFFTWDYITRSPVIWLAFAICKLSENTFMINLEQGRQLYIRLGTIIQQYRDGDGQPREEGFLSQQIFHLHRNFKNMDRKRIPGLVDLKIAHQSDINLVDDQMSVGHITLSRLVPKSGSKSASYRIVFRKSLGMAFQKENYWSKSEHSQPLKTKSLPISLFYMLLLSISMLLGTLTMALVRSHHQLHQFPSATWHSFGPAFAYSDLNLAAGYQTEPAEKSMPAATWLNGSRAWVYYEETDSQLLEFGLDDYRDVSWRDNSSTWRQYQDTGNQPLPLCNNPASSMSWTARLAKTLEDILLHYGGRNSFDNSTMGPFGLRLGAKSGESNLAYVGISRVARRKGSDREGIARRIFGSL
jgi:hypothetical protein